MRGTNGRPAMHEPEEHEQWAFTATPAHRGEIMLRFGICGAGGSGKSYSALAIASALAKRLGTGPLFVIDSENGSALRYARSGRTGRGFDFMHVPMPTDDYSPRSYMRALDYCEDQGAGVILVDSISHEYDGPGGVLEIVDNAGGGRDNFAGWKVATPQHKRFLQRLNTVNAHLIFTVRAKTAYEQRDDTRPGRQGKKVFEKVGLGPVQREGIEYEPDIFGWMNDATLTIDKTRCDRIEPQSAWHHPGDDVAALLADWINDTGDNPIDKAIADAIEAGRAAANAKDAAGYKRARDVLAKSVRALRGDVEQALAKMRAGVEGAAASNGTSEPQREPGEDG